MNWLVAFEDMLEADLIVTFWKGWKDDGPFYQVEVYRGKTIIATAAGDKPPAALLAAYDAIPED